MQYTEPKTQNINNIHVADTLPPPSVEDTDQHIRLDIDPDDDSVQVLEDDGQIE
jgi:hypothetical protein